MNLTLIAAGCLAFLVGLVHSILGEILIFRQVTEGRLFDSEGTPILGRRKVRILRVSWHVATLFGWALAALLLRYSGLFSDEWSSNADQNVVALAFLSGAVLTLVGTKAKHPGWIAMGIVALLIGLA